MMENDLEKLKGKQVTIFVRYGFKKKVDETQSYIGELISFGKHGVTIKRNITELDNLIVDDLFPWHNIIAMRFRSEK